MKKTLMLVVLFTLSCIVTAQEKITEGIFISKQTMSTDNEQMQATFDAMGEMTTKTYLKGKKSRAEMSNPMSGDIVAIVDAESMTSLTLMDSAMGKKYMKTKVENEDELLKDITVEEGSETKIILGYECKQYIVTMNQNGIEMKMSMYVTDQIEPVMSSNNLVLYEKINGFPMLTEIEMNQMGMQMTITNEVTKIDKTEVSDDLFSLTPPEGYTKMEGM
ncbi:DUF4412 domain-containing protein [Winogradskyella aquimaris]|uniref:DUF4412 domain-containing protein n=1 Tax=Winogradskyella aquimaris TaxID=864074 RepID=A0ABU5EMU8_9FLAO|nr:DUF4412 domain-containing protein [Winogradskyella aquimaris]MDY2587558.1 DUF4412 domain-containing protein [Winogradskyella aquimaris]